MISKFHLFAAALAGVLVCSAAGAQVRNGSSPVVQRSPRLARPAPLVSVNSAANPATAVPSSKQAGMIQISPRGRITSGFAPIADSFSFDDNSGVPGLGFDFPHLAAISGALRNGSFRFGHRHHFEQGSFVPILFGGYPYYPYYADDLGYDQQGQQPAQQPPQQSQPQPQIIVIQLPVPAQQAADSGNDAGNLSATGSATQAEVPIRDVGNFILVRRDGRILFASVFSVVGTQLQYVTPEGIRRTLEISDLDEDATQQMNEARGTTVQIHN
jgi:hypothetical protein